MRLFIISSIIVLSLPNLLFAQQTSKPDNFEKADAHVSQISKQLIFQPELLANKLSEGLSNDFDKVRAFYVWIAKNIEYDLLAYIHKQNTTQSVREVLTSGKALCLGYSLLFDYFCEQSGISCEVMDGYAKGLGYVKNQTFKATNHAWNAVKIHGSWYLLDVTWASGDPRDLSMHQKNYALDEYFLVPPVTFIETHLPEDPSWQLMDDKVTLVEFEKGIKSDIEKLEMNQYNPEDYNLLDDFDKELLKYKRAVQFNPKNSELYERLSFAYVYKAISITDEIYTFELKTLLDTLGTLDTIFYALLDSAQLTIDPLENWKIPRFRSILEDESNYQKGVFNYEIGTELFRKSRNQQSNAKQISVFTSTYYNQAALNFSLVTHQSIYYTSAREYLSNIDSFKKRELE